MQCIIGEEKLWTCGTCLCNERIYVFKGDKNHVYKSSLSRKSAHFLFFFFFFRKMFTFKWHEKLEQFSLDRTGSACYTNTSVRLIHFKDILNFLSPGFIKFKDYVLCEFAKTQVLAGGFKILNFLGFLGLMRPEKGTSIHI